MPQNRSELRGTFGAHKLSPLLNVTEVLLRDFELLGKVGLRGAISLPETFEHPSERFLLTD